MVHRLGHFQAYSKRELSFLFSIKFLQEDILGKGRVKVGGRGIEGGEWERGERGDGGGGKWVDEEVRAGEGNGVKGRGGGGGMG